MQKSKKGRNDQTLTYDMVRQFPLVSGLDCRGSKNPATGKSYHHVKNKKERTYHTESYGISTYEIINHIKGFTTVAAPRFFADETKRNSKLIIIDIDGPRDDYDVWNTEEIVRKVVDELQTTPFYIEYNKKTTGYHLYFRFKHFVNDYALSKFQEYIGEYRDSL